MSHRLATTLLGLLLLLTGILLARAHHAMPLPPHSAHDGFLLVPQMVDLLEGQTPVDGRFGMFHPTWFSDRVDPTHATSWAGFSERLIGNVQSHTWIDLPHPMAWMALLTHTTGLGTWAPFLVQWAYLCLLIGCLYAIGRRAHGPACGLLAGVIALGSPGVTGMVQYIAPHLALVAMTAAVVCLLIHLEGLRRWGIALLASAALWSLSRTGEGSGDAVIAGLVVIGPVLAVLVKREAGMPARRWLLGVLAMLLPLLLLADLTWMMAAMERVTRAFADPLVQTDVVAKGGLLSHPMAWLGAYGVLLVTDYALPALSIGLLVGFVGLRGARFKHRWLLLAWTLVPWVALSWMQRKASWYGLPLLPPLFVLAAIGLSHFHIKVRWMVAGVALCQWWTISTSGGDEVRSWLTRPLPLHDWRLRRIDMFQPMNTPASRAVRADLDGLADWLAQRGDPGPVALITMGTQQDYAARYYLAMRQTGLQVVNITDPRLRSGGYRGLHPGDFSALIFIDDGAQPWPPNSQQKTWLRQNLGCATDDPFDDFLSAIWKRAGDREDGFYPLSGSAPGQMGPGQIWTGPKAIGGICAP